jgi:uroporphyrinogen decarboxylase
VSQLVSELGDVPLIGFAGAPFTWRPISSRAAQPAPRAHQGDDAGRTRDLACPDDALTDATIAFLQIQLDAGVDAIQVFDSWAGTL